MKNRSLRSIKCLFAGWLVLNLIMLTGCDKTAEKVINVNFMANAGKAEVELTSGYSAIGNDSVVKTVAVVQGSEVTVPEDPTREGYDFDGWYIDRECTVLWDKTCIPEKSMSVYAGWKRSGSTETQDYSEPVFEIKNGTCDTSVGLIVRTVCNAPVSNGTVELTDASVNMLKRSEDVTGLLGIDMANGASVLSAVYSDSMIIVRWKNDTAEKTEKITVKNVTGKFSVDNSTYENKAKKYEAKETPKPGCVLLAGSSSMENWSTSDNDMLPLTSFNVGIGGTTAEQWSDSLAERLVFPYSPRAVVFYVGINNVINAGNTGEETGNAVVTLLAKVHDRLPDADVYYVKMNLIPGYMKYKDTIEQGNAIVEKYAKDNEWLTLIDAGSLLLKDNGIPNSAYFLTDGLHMSLCGYTIWGKEVRDSVIRHESK